MTYVVAPIISKAEDGNDEGELVFITKWESVIT